MRTFSEYLNESGGLDTITNINEKSDYELINPTPEILAQVEKALPDFEKLISKTLGTKTPLKLQVRINNHKDGIQLWSDVNLVKELGNTLVKTIFKEIKIEFWGGYTTKDWVSFNPKLHYSHPGGGNNGVDFVWRGVKLHLDTGKWETTETIY